MRIAVIIPTRRDRRELFNNTLRLISNQTLRVNHIEVIGHHNHSASCDITKRYKEGYNSLRGKGFDVILFMEDDDWYANDYIEIMVKAWVNHDCPDIFGTSYTYYYHLKFTSYFKMHHSQRSNMMSTLIKPDLDISWSKDEDPYTDAWLWHRIKGTVFTPDKVIAIGMKHGIGKCGGNYHITQVDRFIHKDKDLKFMKSNVDSESIDLYKSMFSDYWS